MQVFGKRRIDLWVYPLLLMAGVGGFFLVRWLGSGLPAPRGSAGEGHAPAAAAVSLFQVLVALLVVVATARIFGALFARLRQPPVMGEIVAGIVLGPSVLGRLAPGAMATVLPAAVTPYLSALAQIGVVLYMFVVGVGLDLGSLRHRAHATVLVSHSSIVVPFLFGSALSLVLYRSFAPTGTTFTVFALFLGVSMSVTAFPVLARILTDRGMQTTPLGRVALTCAAVDDVTAWCLLALLMSVARADSAGAIRTVSLALVYVLVMIIVARPALARWVAKRDGQGLTRPLMGAACVALLASTLVTEAIGIHALFGAFLMGAIIPAESRIARELTERLEDIVVILFLPAFFAFTGLRTEIGLVRGTEHWLLCGAIVLVATAGKFGGSTVAARSTGLSWRESASLGVLMNTRGLMELIVLNVGLDLGVISPALFAMLVLMAIVTTFATSPALDWIRGGALAPGAVTES